ncbi:hypothetical protein VSR68_37065 [Paraburkholderia phymatum]|uniref:hypothetical protein n=1 Tax=Paraburkholderia phymatum TaxID=148447 RepID=UPI0031772E12
MSVPPCPTRAFTGARFRYADRVHAVTDGENAFDILIDGQLRFRLEGDSQWPTQWRLYPVTAGVREAQWVAMENERWDIIGQLERGAHWMSATDIEPESRQARCLTTYTRFPEYLGEN